MAGWDEAHRWGDTMDRSELLREIGRATFDESRWPVVMGLLSRHLGAAGAFMFSPSETSGTRSFGKAVDLPAEMSRRYLAEFHAYDLVLQTARERDLLHAGSIVASQTLVPDEILHRSAFYNDFLRDYDMHSALGAILTDEDDVALGPRTHLAFTRPRGAPAYSYQDERRLAAFVPQLRLALTSHWALRGQGLLGEWNEQVLAQIDRPFFLLSRGGRMLFGNQAGLNLVRDSRSLSLRDGILCRGLDALPLVEQFEQRTEVAVDLPKLAPDCPEIKVVPLKPTQTTQSMFRWFPRAAYVVMPQATHEITSDGLASERHRGRLVSDFAHQHALTPAEQLVLSRLLEGMSPRSVAEGLKVSVHTVRAHLAHIYAKTGLRNQRELVTTVYKSDRP